MVFTITIINQLNYYFMKKKDLEKQELEISSMNEQLFDEFHLKELEQRLETDPFLVGGLMNSSSADCFKCNVGQFTCSSTFIIE